jgi:hypothetical protein
MPTERGVAGKLLVSRQAGCFVEPLPLDHSMNSRTRPQQFPTNKLPLFCLNLAFSDTRRWRDSVWVPRRPSQLSRLPHTMFKSECRIQACSHFSPMFLFWVPILPLLVTCQAVNCQNLLQPTKLSGLRYLYSHSPLLLFTFNRSQQSAAPALKPRATYSAVRIRGGGSGSGGSWTPRPVTPA